MTRRSTGDGMDTQIDRHLGVVLRRRRRLLGMTQAQLASAVGTKFQQIHRYETGEVKISAARLWSLAIALGVPLEGLDKGDTAVAKRLAEADGRPLRQTA